MASTQQGTFAVVFGLPTGLVIATGIRVTNYDLSKEAESEETRDEDGEVVNITTFGKRTKITVTCYPTAASTALAVTANVLPEVGSEAAMIATGKQDADATTTSPGTKYTVKGSSKAVSNSGKVIWTVNLERVAGISSYTPLS